MSDMKYTFVIDGEEWKGCHLERLAYERNLHILHQMKQHGIEIKDEERVLSDDEIDYLTADKAWEVSKEVRGSYSGKEMMGFYKDSFEKSDELWRKLDYGQDKPMKVSRCYLTVKGLMLPEFMQVMQKMLHATVNCLNLNDFNLRLLRGIINRKPHNILAVCRKNSHTLMILRDVINLSVLLRNTRNKLFHHYMGINSFSHFALLILLSVTIK